MPLLAALLASHFNNKPAPQAKISPPSQLTSEDATEDAHRAASPPPFQLSRSMELALGLIAEAGKEVPYQPLSYTTRISAKVTGYHQ